LIVFAFGNQHVLASARVEHDDTKSGRIAAGYRERFPVLRRSSTLLLITGFSPKSFPTLLFRTASLLLMLSFAHLAHSQETNPVDRKVTNPMTDTPNVNPLIQDQPIRPATRENTGDGEPTTDTLTIESETQSVSGPEKARVFVYNGNVDARIGTYRLQADKLTVYEANNLVIAEGSVVFDQADQQRITGSRAEWNYATKLGFFEKSTGYTNQTQDGTRVYFTADRIERVSADTYVATNAEITACDEEVPKWSFTASRAQIKTGDRVRIKGANLRVKKVPVFFLPFASVSIKKRDRASGFLTPTVSGSGEKGFRLSNAYYQTLGRSADLTLRNDIYAERGLGFGADLRTRANSRSFLNMGFFAVKDRIFGPKEDAEHPNQGGSSFYADGVHYFPNGFLAAADVNITSNFAFRQVFSDSIQTAISPEERSQVFINRNFREYSFDFLARSQVTSLPNTRVRIRQLPSASLEKRPTPLKYFEKIPAYFSFETSVEGVSRKETVEDAAQFEAEVGALPIVTPSMVQRLDFHPNIAIPFHYAGWSATASAGVRATYYSNSIDPTTRLVLSRDVVRGYSEFELDLRPPAFARNFKHKDGSFFFRHVIEPYLTYRKISGISNFERIILFDYVDAIADTNEIEFGIANRFYTRRSTENVSGASAKLATTDTKAPLATQPYEALSITLRGKYFFDPTFGGALVPGRRNQFYPINTFSGFTYGGVPRRFSPINLEARYRPRRSLSADVRMDFDVESVGVRDLSVGFGLDRRLIQVFQTFYYTRAIRLAPSLERFADPRGLEAGTLRGSQWSPSVFLGNRERGLFGGASYFFDFQNRPGQGSSSLISSTLTLGYSWDCCAVTVQNYTFNVGVRHEDRVVFSFRLNGIGTFGTEQIGQPFK
jgi:LPS-assembly protein